MGNEGVSAKRHHCPVHKMCGPGNVSGQILSFVFNLIENKWRLRHRFSYYVGYL